MFTSAYWQVGSMRRIFELHSTDTNDRLYRPS